ncbi:F-box/FBD/LRR-repeat protein At1g13570-like [Rhododendron vialii]|uniref:F-box/FBD/LRR-repeat protein At1g13570-like n=1 Tax=Rhododendron vialii TaxID=182163 RepID=UPI00265FFC90|nr:F-box/FBD/LRR-repeat protein At1g13570-like [Rhododendron vialii]
MGNGNVPAMQVRNLMDTALKPVSCVLVRMLVCNRFLESNLSADHLADCPCSAKSNGVTKCFQKPLQSTNLTTEMQIICRRFIRVIEIVYFDVIDLLVLSPFKDYRTKMNTCDSNSDIISLVPGNIRENIIMCLPIQDAVRTSLLSRKWRYVWSKLPQLVFDDKFYRHVYGTTNAELLMIDQLIRFVSNNDIQDFALHIWQGVYKLPSSLYSCLQLRHLKLHSCILKPPPGFEGFARLISLDLCDVAIADDILSSLISNCPLLEDLRLQSSNSLHSLEVAGPNLRKVLCEGHFRSICFTNTSRLANVEIYLNEYRKELFCGKEETPNSGIAASSVPTRLPTTLNNLKHITLNEICFGERDEVSVLICLIRSSPNLEKITIEAFPGATSAIPIDLDFSEAMLIELNSSHVDADELRIVKELTRLRCASPQAEMNIVSRDDQD